MRREKKATHTDVELDRDDPFLRFATFSSTTMEKTDYTM